MSVVIKIIAWSLIGAILGFVLVYGGLEAYYRIFEPVAVNDTNEVRGWQGFSAMMAGGAGAGVGFLAGLVYGIVLRRAIRGGEAP